MGNESANALLTPRAPSEKRHHIIGKSNISLVTVPASARRFHNRSPAELKRYSRAILYRIVYGNNSARENRLLRDLYWNMLTTLARLENVR